MKIDNIIFLFKITINNSKFNNSSILKFYGFLFVFLNLKKERKSFWMVQFLFVTLSEFRDFYTIKSFEVR